MISESSNSVWRRRVLGRRRMKLTVFVVSGGLLALTMVWSATSQRQRDEALFTRASLAGQLTVTDQQLTLAKHQVARAHAAAAMVAEARQQGIIPAAWNSNSINVVRQNLDRPETNRMLSGLDVDAQRIPQLERFDVSVTNMDDGLFTPPDTQAYSRPIQVTITGTEYFSAGGVGAQ